MYNGWQWRGTEAVIPAPTRNRLVSNGARGFESRPRAPSNAILDCLLKRPRETEIGDTLESNLLSNTEKSGCEQSM